MIELIPAGSLNAIKQDMLRAARAARAPVGTSNRIKTNIRNI
jgi:hypothetical protein